MLITLFLILGVCLGIMGVAFFAVSEISLVVSDKLALLDREEKQEPGVMPLLKILSRPESISHTLLVGTVISGGVSSLSFTLLLLRWRPELAFTWLLFLLIVVELFLLTLFGEVVPRILYYHRAEESVIQIAGPLSSFMWFFRPLIDLSRYFYQTVQSLSGKRETEESPFVDEEDLEWIRRFAVGSETLRMEEARIIRKIFDFSDIRVHEIRVSVDHVVSVSEEADVSQAMGQVLESGYTRLPVYRGEANRIVGVLYVLDLLRARDLNQKVGDCDRKPFFVHPDTLVRDLFKSMQKRGIMMAVVRSEEGDAQGIITMEDILEEIFGEIEDEYDLKDQLFRETGDKEYLVNASVNVKELNEQLHLGIPEDGYKSLSGYILHYLRRIPREGERFTIGSLMFKIELADEKQIYKLFLRQLKVRKK